MTTRRLGLYAIWLTVCGAVAASTFFAQVGAASGASWDAEPDAVLVSYKDVWAEFRDQDPTPLLRVFGDGRVLVHYPAYSPKAGQYALQLAPQELDSLMTSLLSKGLATVDLEALRTTKAAEEQRLRYAARDAARVEALRGVPMAERTPELFMVADDSTAVFEIHLSNYRPAGNAYAEAINVDRTVLWHGLRTDAERYPAIEAIQQLRAAELELRALLERADLRRVQR